MRTLTLVDWCWAGRVPLHAESISRLFLNNGWGVNHVGPDADAAEVHLNEHCGLDVTCHEMAALPTSGSSLAQRESIQFRWNALADVLEVLQTGGLLDFVFIPGIDVQLDQSVTTASIPNLLNVPWGALLLNAGDFSSPATGGFRRRNRHQRYQSLHHPALTHLVTLDELALGQLEAAFPSVHVGWMPDLMEPNPETFENLLGIRRSTGPAAA